MDLISKVPDRDFDMCPVPERMKIPIRMVSAGVSNLSRLKSALEQEEKDSLSQIRMDFYRSEFNRRLRIFFKVFFIILLILFVVEVIIAIWIWQMPTDKYNRFLSCLDVGTVSSLKERLAYYMACFMGSLGG